MPKIASQVATEHRGSAVPQKNLVQASMLGLKRHGREKEEKPNPGPSQNSTPHQNELTCSLCSKTFRSRTGFREHQDKHVVGSKSHFCPVVDCERKFTTITTLQRHIASKHQGIKISAGQCNIKDKFEEKNCNQFLSLVTNLYVLL